MARLRVQEFEHESGVVLIGKAQEKAIRIRYKHSSLKQYYKDGQALRTETMFNNPYDFGIKRSLESFSQLVEMGYEFDDHLLELEQVSQDKGIVTIQR